MTENQEIIMYGTSWCSDTRRSKLFFRKQKVEYTYIDLDKHPEYDEKVREINDGNRSVPTIFFPDGDIFVEPSNDKLKDKFISLGLSTR